MKKRIVIFSTIVLIFTVSYFSLEAQQANVRFQQAGNLEDYTFKQTTCLFQDSRGLIWFGAKGLNCFDGHRITPYRYNPFDTLGLTEAMISSITEDDQNRLWMLSWGLRLHSFDLESEKISHVPLPQDTSEWGSGYIKYDSEGFLWLGGCHGIYRYYPEIEAIDQVPMSDLPLTGNYHYFTLVDYDTTGTLWVLDQVHGLYHLDREKDILVPQNLDLPQLPGGINQNTKCCLDQDGIFWILGELSQLTRFNPYTLALDLIIPPLMDSPAANTGGGIAVDHEGKIWFGLVHSLKSYDPKTGIIERFKFEEPRTVIRDIIIDKQGNIFIATLEGIRILDKKASMIKSYSSFSDTIVKEAKWISEVIRDEESLWIGTFGCGVIRYHVETAETRYYRKGMQDSNLSSNYSVRILKDRQNQIWVMTHSGDLYKYNSQKDYFDHIPLNTFRFITVDKDHKFWLARREGLLQFDPLTFDTLFLPFREPLPLPWYSLDYTPFIQDQDGLFWMGGLEGLYRIDPGTGSWTRFRHHRNDPNSLINDNVRDLYCDSKNRIWMGTSQGLSMILRYPGADHISFKNFSLSNPELTRITRITEDASGNIWVGTFDGAILIKTDGSIMTLDHRDGLPEISKIFWALNTDSKGRIYGGHLNVVEIPPDYMQMNRVIPPILLTEMSISGKKVFPGDDSPLKQSLSFTEGIHLKHDQNFLRLEFAALNYTDPHRNQYRYLMEGVDQDTVEAHERGYAEYTDLSPGKYRFWVTGSNNTGLWNPDGVSINIRIHPPLQRSIAALAIYLLLLLALIYGFLRFRTTRLREEKLKLENEVVIRTAEVNQKNEQIVEMERLKTNFFTDISHEIRTPLSLISGPLDKLIKEESMSQKQSEWLAMIKRNSQRLLQLVNQLLDIARLDSGHMKLVLENSDVLKNIRVLVNGYHSLAEKNHIHYILDIPERELVSWNDWDKINKIVTNLLSNAFKFTPDFGTVTFRVKTESGSPDKRSTNIRLIVADTGPGIPNGEHEKIFERFYRADYHYEEASGTGIGLAVTRELVELMHGESIVKSIEGKGSVFIVTIPLGKEHLKVKEYVLKEDLKHISRTNVDENFLDETISKEEIVQQDIDILIVEDNQEVRSFVMENLESTYRIIEAEDGLRGLEMAVSSIPDLIITDIMMPGMDGMALCKKLKNDERTSHIPVIMLTARASDDDKIDGLETGVDDYIIKPFNIEELSVRIQNLIDQRRRLQLKYSAMIGIDWTNVSITTLDEEFLRKLTNTITEHLGDLSFDVGVLQREMAMSRSNLYRKLKALTDESPVSLIRNMRLKLAASMMENDSNNITQIMMSVGFSNPSYFAKCFKEYFGTTPKLYQKAYSKSN